MFTVLHRGPDGSETYYECQTVTRFTKEGEQTVPPLGEIRLGGVHCADVPGNTVTLAVEAPFGAVFIMNETGHTVAKYTLAGKVGPGLEGAEDAG